MTTFIEAEKAHYSEAALCRALGVARSGVIARRHKPEPSVRESENAELTAKIRRVHVTHRGRYGSPRIFQQLRIDGERVSENRVARVMRSAGICAKTKRRFVRTTDSAHDHAVAPNLLEREFTATAPNQVWVGDVTYLATDEGWAYLAVLIDLYARKVVGWALEPTLATELTLLALERAGSSRVPGSALVHHTDRGSNYCADDYQAALRRLNITPSMSRVGDCWDNAVAESFFATLKRELGDTFPSRSEANRSVGAFIHYYNLTRLHSTNNYQSPVQRELAYEARLAA